MLSVLGFLIVLGPLVVAHEFGHYIFARIFGVKAEIFSVGFGKKIWSRQMGETELRISWIPLGGYVKLLGEDREAPLSPEDAARSLYRQAAWKRFFIFFGGPLFNFCFAILIFMAILAIGEPQVSNVVARVVQDSPAAQAGFRSGDRVLAIDGTPIRHYDDILDVLEENPGKQVNVQVLHAGSKDPVQLSVMAESQEGYSAYGEEKAIGEVAGLLPSARSTRIGISDPRSVAGKAGLQTGDAIVEFNGSPVKDFEEVEALYESAPAKSAIGLKIEKANKSVLQAVLTKPSKNESLSRAWGLYSTELFVEKVVPASPAAQLGLQAGDRIVSIGSGTKKEIQSFFALKDAVQKSGETEGKVSLQWEHEGKLVSAIVTPSANTSRNAILKRTTNYTVGIMPMLELVEPEMTVERIWNPFTLLYKGTQRMIVFSWRNLVSIQKILVGDVSVATLGGPIMIGKIAGEAMTRGLIEFLHFMAMISIGLGVLNVLPIPVLDGGHLMLLVIETLRGKPMTLRTMEIIQSVGLSAILLLMVLVLRNDITRLIP